MLLEYCFIFSKKKLIFWILQNELNFSVYKGLLLKSSYMTYTASVFMKTHSGQIQRDQKTLTIAQKAPINSLPVHSP